LPCVIATGRGKPQVQPCPQCAPKPTAGRQNGARRDGPNCRHGPWRCARLIH